MKRSITQPTEGQTRQHAIPWLGSGIPSLGHYSVAQWRIDQEITRLCIGSIMHRDDGFHDV